MNKKKIVLLILAVILVISLGKFGVNTYQEMTLDHDQLFIDAVEGTVNLTSYRFYTESTLQLNNDKEAKTTVTGEKDKNGNLHVWGEIMDTPIEIYQIGTTHYRLDHQNQKWIMVKNTTLPDEALLMMEIDPIANLKLADMSNRTYHDKVKTKRGKMYEYGLIPKDGDHIASAYFQDLLLTIDINKDIPAIGRFTISGKTKANTNNQLNMTTDIFDYNNDIEVVAPQQ